MIKPYDKQGRDLLSLLSNVLAAEVHEMGFAIKTMDLRELSDDVWWTYIPNQLMHHSEQIISKLEEAGYQIALPGQVIIDQASQKVSENA